eukprot:8510781-Pyramimonas_sp.AAC.1
MELVEPDLQHNCFCCVPFTYEDTNVVALEDGPVVRVRQYSLADVQKVVHDYIGYFFCESD